MVWPQVTTTGPFPGAALTVRVLRSGTEMAYTGVTGANSVLYPTCSDGVRNGDETGTDCGGCVPLVCWQRLLSPFSLKLFNLSVSSLAIFFCSFASAPFRYLTSRLAAMTMAFTLVAQPSRVSFEC